MYHTVFKTSGENGQLFTQPFALGTDETELVPLVSKSCYSSYDKVTAIIEKMLASKPAEHDKNDYIFNGWKKYNVLAENSTVTYIPDNSECTLIFDADGGTVSVSGNPALYEKTDYYAVFIRFRQP